MVYQGLSHAFMVKLRMLYHCFKTLLSFTNVTGFDMSQSHICLWHLRLFVWGSPEKRNKS